MPQFITQQEAQKRSLNVGFIMVGKYIKSDIKIQFICPKCKKVFLCLPHSIWKHNTTSCGHCNDPKITDVVNNFTILKVSSNTSKGCRVVAQCKCGTIWNGIFNHLPKTCGHCDDPKIGDKFGRLTIIKVYPSSGGGASIVCQCECGNLWTGQAKLLRSKQVKSCGMCTNPKIGDKFYKLTVCKIYIKRNQGCSVKCKCDCGKYWKGSACFIKTGSVKSCGNCYNIRNGQKTSFKSLELDNLIQKLNYTTQHNDIIWRNGKHKITIDITIPKYKIAIEYDEWVWHGNKIKQDNLRLRKIQRLGWKTLQIKAHRNLPTKQQLINALNFLRNRGKQKTITLSGWGQGKTRFPIKD